MPQPHEGYEEMTLTAPEKMPLRNRVMDKDDGSIDWLNLMPVDHGKSLSASESSFFNVSAPSTSFNKETKDRIDRAVDNEECSIDWLNPVPVEQSQFSTELSFDVTGTTSNIPSDDWLGVREKVVMDKLPASVLSSFDEAANSNHSI